MKKIGRLVFKPNKAFWGVERLSFVIYKNKGNYFVRVYEKNKALKKLLDWASGRMGRIDLGYMMKMVNNKKYCGGKITINTLPKEVMDRANKELILENLR